MDKVTTQDMNDIYTAIRMLADAREIIKHQLAQGTNNRYLQWCKDAETTIYWADLAYQKIDQAR